MAFIRKYRPLIAILLLAIYGFITTPTTLWHQHLVTNNDGNVCATGKVALAQDNTVVSDECAICAHQYAVYTHMIAPMPIWIDPEIKVFNDFLLLPQLSVSFVFHFNKGPPLFA